MIDPQTGLDAVRHVGINGNRIAAISAFGFGGNNAHLILSENDPELSAAGLAMTEPAEDAIAVVGIGAIAGTAANRAWPRNAGSVKGRASRARSTSGCS